MSVTQQDVKEGRINDQLENQLDSISAQVEAGWDEGKNKFADWRQTATDKSRELTDSLQTMAREKPWQLVAGATAVGLVLGLLFASRR
jgi:ElaB/YqjD/DUF883 family membrane-anchored ribosome-binding protein